MKVAVTCIQLIRDIDAYRESFRSAGIDLVIPEVSGQHLEGDQLVAALENCLGVIAGDDQFTESVLSNCPDLRVISKWGIGIDGIDTYAAQKLGIIVRNTPGEFNEEVADVAMGYCIMLLRHLHVVDAHVREGSWFKPPGNSLMGKTMGIVGLGGIGQAVARRSITAGMDVIGVDPHFDRQEEASRLGVGIVKFDELLGMSNIISINCPLNSQTHHMFDEDAFAKINNGAWLINVGRGGVIKTDALVSAIEKKVLAGVALDVLEEEPLKLGSPLSRFTNVIFGSHNASNTIEASERVHIRAIQNLANELGVKIAL